MVINQLNGLRRNSSTSGEGITKYRNRYLASNLLNGRDVGAELHRLDGNLTTAGAERNSRADQRHEDDGLLTLHGLLSYAFCGIRR